MTCHAGIRWARAARRLAPIAILGGAALAGSCSIPLPKPSADQTRHYVLTAVPPAEAAPAAARRWVVGLRAVDVAGYLRNRSLAIRSQANEILYQDFARWGEPLDEGVARVLADDLAAAPGVARVARPPFRGDEPRDCEVAVLVTACEGTADGEVRFTANWRIQRASGSAGPAGTYTAAGLHWDRHDDGQLAARLSEAVAGLGRQIAEALSRETPGS